MSPYFFPIKTVGIFILIPEESFTIITCYGLDNY